tara:strand:- start:1561 stop:2418 length:858 start_codon:yes stop_codon:yes gene_type:complete
MKEGLVFEKNKIVIGGDIRALLYAYLHELPVVYSRPNPPFRFDMFPGTELESIGLGSVEPSSCRQIWEKLVFLLGISGLMPINTLDNSLRIKDSILNVSSGAKTIKFKFNKLVIFEDEGITGLPKVLKEEKGKNRVIDWVNVRSGCRHNHLYLEDDQTSFVREIYFYPMNRSDNRKLKDLVAVSYLTDKQLKDFEFSDTMAKFKIIEMMKDTGIRGARNGRDVNNPDRYKYYAVKIEPAERQVFSSTVRYYEPDDRFEFSYDTIERLLENREKPKGYLRKLCEAI